MRCDQLVVVNTPSASTSTPQPVRTHQQTCVALVNPPVTAPLDSPAAAAEPTRATPRVWPTWRLVDAIAAATPAWLAGMPDTAVLVMGAFTAPKPAPKIT